MDAHLFRPYGDLMTTANYTFFMHLKTSNDWLALKPTQRHRFVDDVVRPILAAHPGVSLRYFDAEAFSGAVSDVAMWETADVIAYQSVCEQLRETQFWGHYFDVVDIVPAIENAFAHHYHVDPI